MDTHRRPARREQPDHVLFACVLAFFGIALGLLIWLVIAMLYAFHQPIAEVGWHQAISFLVITLVVVAVTIPMFVLIRLTWRGHRWAGIGLTVVGALFVLAGLAPLRSQVIVGLPVTVYTLVWLVLLWWGPASWRDRRS